jgi:hypothetical protein
MRAIFSMSALPDRVDQPGDEDRRQVVDAIVARSPGTG